LGGLPLEIGILFYYHYRMKSVKKSIFVLFLLWGIIYISYAADDGKEICLTVPVRAFDGKESIRDLKKQDFHLSINNREIELRKVIELEAALVRKPEFLGRNFVLSFHMTHYNANVQKAISYFVTEILNNSDFMILITPLKIYRINISSNKTRVINDIETLVRTDCIEYGKTVSAALKNLNIQMRQMERFFRGEVIDPGLATSYKIIATFLAAFPQAFLNFRNLYLYPDVGNYRKALDFLGNREGERWWIHFQQGDSYSVAVRAQNLAKKIDDYCNLYELARQSFQNYLQQLQKLVQAADSFPSKSLMETFLDYNVRYNSIFWVQEQEKNRGNQIISHITSLLQNISGETGGKTIYSANPQQGLIEITKHRDRFYRLTFKLNNSNEPKQVVITPSVSRKNMKLFYKTNYSNDEINALAKYNAEEKPEIMDFSLKKGELKFSIKKLKQNGQGDKAFGLAKVRLQLFDKEGNRKFSTENTLRSTRKTITVSIPLPRQLRGQFILEIKVYDIIANRLLEFSRDIVLNH